jgi:SAM-dependent methyltransferase
MRNVYHHFGDPAAMNASIFRSLKPGGRLAVVDFAPPGKEAERAADRGKDGMHGVSAETVARELKAAGFTVADTTAGTDRWFMVVAAKPAGDVYSTLFRRELRVGFDFANLQDMPLHVR